MGPEMTFKKASCSPGVEFPDREKQRNEPKDRTGILPRRSITDVEVSDEEQKQQRCCQDG